ncbi:MAG TPA: nucleotidyltransferase family protein [Candidatus Acidoferrum sp.]|jgi:molybdenum cofactor cytidylyltransferase|nr:nucleotidyltransferase family protein [Candidatus Acidoferrum sp.]
MLAAIILSGGASRRMGSPKALLPYQGRPFLEHLLDVAMHPSIGVRRVVLGPDADAISAQVSLTKEEIVINSEWQRGQISSIQAAIRSLPPTTDGILLCPVDHPLVSAALVGDLIEAFQKNHPAIALPIYEGRRGHPVIFAARLYDELLNAPEDKGARAVVWAHAGEICEVATNEEGCVLNLNDPEAFLKISNP